MKNKKLALFLSVLMLSSISLWAQSTQNPDTICAGAMTYYKVASANSGSTYAWGIVNSEGSITEGDGTDSIRVTWNNTIGSDTLWVIETNVAGCISDTSKLTIVRHTAPTASFNKAALCYGDTLRVSLTGVAPWNLVYTQNGSTVSQMSINTNSYDIGGAPGNYALVRIEDKFCTNNTLTGTSVVTVPITRPLIEHE